MRHYALVALIALCLLAAPAGTAEAQNLLVPARNPVMINNVDGVPETIIVNLMDGSAQAYDIMRARPGSATYDLDPGNFYDLWVLPREHGVRLFLVTNAPRNFQPGGSLRITVAGEPETTGRYGVNPGFTRNDCSLMGPR